MYARETDGLNRIKRWDHFVSVDIVDIVDKAGGKMREAAFEQKLKKRVREMGGLCLKWVSPGFTGVPDRIIFLPGGRIIFAEVKRPDLKADGRTKRQLRVADQLRALGCVVIRINKLEDLDVAIKEVRP